MLDPNQTDPPPGGDLVARSRAALGWPELLAALADRACSTPGRRECLDPTLAETAAACELTLAETEEMAGLFERGDSPPATPIADVGPLVESARAEATLEPLDLIKIGDLLGHARDARAFYVGRDRLLRLAEWAARLDEVKELRRALERSIDRDGAVLDGASPELGALRRRRVTLSERIHRRLSELVARHQEDALQDSYYTERGGRYVLPVKASARMKLKGIVHDASGSGQTVFLEPEELIEPNNQLRLIAAEIEKEIQRVLRELSAQVAQNADPIVVDQRVLGRLDAVRARARLAAELGASRPLMNERGVVRLKNLRHPLLVLRGHETVANHLELGVDAKVMVISGPNAGGKTVALGAAGLAALMARAGMFVAADPGSELCVADQVFAVIGDDQDLARDLSTFAAHLLDLRAILEAATPRSIVLLDELMGSTDPEEGAALGAAILQRLCRMGALVIATTHLPALKSFAHEQDGFINASFAFDPQTLAPTYRFLAGVPGRSMGIDMARRLGLDPAVIDEARSRLDGSKLRMESLLTELAGRLKNLDEEGLALERLKRDAEETGAEYHELLDQTRRRERESKRELKDAVKRATRGAEDEIDRLLAELRGRDQISRDQLIRARKRIAEVKEETAARFGLEQETARTMDWSRAKTGDRVRVAPLGVEAELLELPEKGAGEDAELSVRIGNLTARIEVKKVVALIETAAPAGEAVLKPPPKKPRPARAAHAAANLAAPGASSGGVSSPLLPQSKRNTLDLRGLRYNEAEARVESFLDRAATELLPNVYVIHGHGTGALKKMVRELLSASPYVKSHRPGEQGEGGDGVTMAELND